MKLQQDLQNLSNFLSPCLSENTAFFANEYGVFQAIIELQSFLWHELDERSGPGMTRVNTERVPDIWLKQNSGLDWLLLVHVQIRISLNEIINLCIVFRIRSIYSLWTAAITDFNEYLQSKNSVLYGKNGWKRPFSIHGAKIHESKNSFQCALYAELVQIFTCSAFIADFNPISPHQLFYKGSSDADLL